MIRRTLGRFIRWANSWDAEACEKLVGSPANQRRTRLDRAEHGINFSLLRANGGYIVQTSFYDEKYDSHTHGLYIINDGEDLGTSIAHIVTTENLRR